MPFLLPWATSLIWPSNHTQPARLINSPPRPPCRLPQSILQKGNKIRFFQPPHLSILGASEVFPICFPPIFHRGLLQSLPSPGVGSQPTLSAPCPLPLRSVPGMPPPPPQRTPTHSCPGCFTQETVHPPADLVILSVLPLLSVS